MPPPPFFYRTRGLWLIAPAVLLLVLKGVLGSGVPAWAWGSLLAVVVATSALRFWGAGYIGAPIRGREVEAASLVTAGPYAYLRHPLYLGILLMVLALTGMSGLWYAPLIVLAMWSLVYASVIPYEEEYLRRTFGEEYDAYREAVPGLLPGLRPYPRRSGEFDVRRAVSGEWFSLVLSVVFSVLFLVVA